jgi:hypothetical protein
MITTGIKSCRNGAVSSLHARCMKTNNPYWNIAFQTVQYSLTQKMNTPMQLVCNKGRMRENNISVRMLLALASLIATRMEKESCAQFDL